ncbi:MAG TPA: 7-carboxy-7-deazaguanine synthase QueE [Chthonomonadales bacterium]|nr:7-carboxy-7-deazaguanine synthase QueE [Chthonomonadales bacterium]
MSSCSRGDLLSGDGAHLTEVFRSVQGEGLLIGVMQVFVRFAGCHLDCLYCDSEPSRRRSRSVQVHARVAGGAPTLLANPLDREALTRVVCALAGDPPVHSISLTGGEPLLQHRFLPSWLRMLRARRLAVYLETAGDLAEQYDAVAPLVDWCAMDLKLPSATGQPPMWERHSAFLEVSRRHRVATFAKAVVSAATPTCEIARAAQLVAGSLPDAWLVLQPVTVTRRSGAAPSAGRLLALADAALSNHPLVRVTPQMHRQAGLP